MPVRQAAHDTVLLRFHRKIPRTTPILVLRDGYRFRVHCISRCVRRRPRARGSITFGTESNGSRSVVLNTKPLTCAVDSPVTRWNTSNPCSTTATIRVKSSRWARDGSISSLASSTSGALDDRLTTRNNDTVLRGMATYARDAYLQFEEGLPNAPLFDPKTNT